ncbi:hypothetical protein TNCV_4956391 [Trichonephila clavipes]|nr:hypothetical protein TNCV_4956391 [Trichonephila clavipes]
MPSFVQRDPEGFRKKGIFLRCTSKKSEEGHTFTQTVQLLTLNPPENRALIERKVPEENIDLGKEDFPLHSQQDYSSPQEITNRRQQQDLSVVFGKPIKSLEAHLCC